jgi:glycosyltransferase involved in cell wall biosynthesis
MQVGLLTPTKHAPQVLTEDLQTASPFFSVCIPQYNRTSFLLKSLESFRQQVFEDFEICISDGGSTDGRHHEIVDFLRRSHLSFRYLRHIRNLRYDQNLRASLDLARGRYCLLLGNDDMLASNDTLQLLRDRILQYGTPEVVIPNFRQSTTGADVRRIRATGILGAGPDVAVANFRNFSFVSGILLLRVGVQKHVTDKWDGSEMYQMYLGCRILAEGGRLLGIDAVVVLKDIEIPGEQVDSYARQPLIQASWFEERRLPLCQFARVALDAVDLHMEAAQRAYYARRIFLQVLLFTYPFWLIEYRRVQSWQFALGVALGMRPRNILASLDVGLGTRLYVACLYALVTVAGLLTPLSLFDRLRSRLFALAKSCW